MHQTYSPAGPASLRGDASRIRLNALSCVAVAAVSVTCSLGLAQEPRVLKTECLVLTLDRASVAARRDGLLEIVHVRLGDEVAEGDELFRQSREEADAHAAAAAAALEQAKIRADNIWSVRAAEAELEKAAKEDSLLREAARTPYLERFRAAQTVEKNAAELRREESTYAESQKEVRIREAENKLAEIDLLDRRVRSPFAGTIVEELKYSGEWAAKGEPVVELLRMDQLMLQGIVSVRDIAPHRIPGAKLRAEFQLTGDSPLVFDDLVVKKSSPEVDLDGNYVIWTHVSNERRKDLRGDPQWLLRPGLTGTLFIELPDTESPQPSGEAQAEE